MNQRTNKSKMAANGDSVKSVPVIRKQLKNIAEEITDDELNKLIFLARDELPKGQTQNINCLRLFGVLEERQLIDTKNNDVHYLLDLLTHIRRLDLCKKLKLASTNHCETDAMPVFHGAMNSVSTHIDTRVTQSSTCDTMTSSTSINHNQEDGRFLQDPDLYNLQDITFIMLKYHETIQKLEKTTQEKQAALLAAQTSDENKMALQSKVNNLEFELRETRDEHNNLICERNIALAAKSEFVFKENEARDEVRQGKRTMNLLQESMIKSNNEVKKTEEENSNLKTELIKYQEQLEDLKNKLEIESSEKESFRQQLEAIKGKLEEGNGRIKCKRCGLVYVETNNPVDACRTHSGQYGSTGSLRKKQEWSCCRNANKNAPGCTKKKHLSIDIRVTPSPDTAQRSFSFSGK